MLTLLLIALQVLAVAQAVPGAQPAARAHHWVVYDELRECVVLTGGSTPINDDSFTFFDDLWAFDGAAWTALGTTGRRESGVRLVSRPGGGLVAFGGYTPGGTHLGELREYVDNRWKVIDPASDKAVAEPGFAYDVKRECFVLFGGSSGPGNKRGTTWEWDGARWRTFDVPAPCPRFTHGMIYDAGRSRVVLFGGTGGVAPASGALGDTWEWDGEIWTEVRCPGPAPRLGPAMAYDSKRGRTLLFGGGAGDGPRGDTWSFDGTKWEELKIPGPPARFTPAMAYDAKRDRVVLFGGRKRWPTDLADTWTFDGNAWQQVGGG